MLGKPSASGELAIVQRNAIFIATHFEEMTTNC